jgi:2-methylcitrate dehydratase
MSETAALLGVARLAHSVRYEDLPDEVVAHAKALILDTVGCAFGGFNTGVGEAVRSIVDELGGHPQATVLGTGARTSMPLATLANGTMLRYLDANDYYFGRDPAHPSGNLAVALAVGEKARCSGRELIAALVAAYEIHLRLCDLAGKPTLWQRGWHHGTNAQFSSAALAARLLGADPTQTAHAMAISGSHHNTLAALQSGEISMIKATAEAWIAKGGVEAAMFAMHGITGPLALLEGKFGWVDSVAGGADLEALVAPIDGRYRIMNTCIKPYPAVAAAIAPIRAAIDLHPQVRTRMDSIQRVTVRMPAYAIGSPSAKEDRRFPATRESADHSFYYCAAIALLEGACGDEQFAEDKLAMPALRRLLEKVELEEDPALTARWPAAGGAVVVHMMDGTLLDAHCEYPPGHPRNALTAEELGAKFHGFADPVLSHAAALRLREQIETLEECTDISALAGNIASN